MRKILLSLTATLGLLWGSPAMAGDVVLNLTAMKEIIVKDKDGNKVVKHVKPEVMTPGDVVVYSVQFANKGKEAKENIVINDPIPAATAYIAGSASGSGATITFSIDGKTFAPEGRLKIEDENGRQRLAEPSEYRFIRWTLNGPLAPGKEGRGSFKVRVR